MKKFAEANMIKIYYRGVERELSSSGPFSPSICMSNWLDHLLVRLNDQIEKGVYDGTVAVKSVFGYIDWLTTESSEIKRLTHRYEENYRLYWSEKLCTTNMPSMYRDGFHPDDDDDQEDYSVGDTVILPDGTKYVITEVIVAASDLDQLDFDHNWLDDRDNDANRPKINPEWVKLQGALEKHKSKRTAQDWDLIVRKNEIEEYL